MHSKFFRVDNFWCFLLLLSEYPDVFCCINFTIWELWTRYICPSNDLSRWNEISLLQLFKIVAFWMHELDLFRRIDIVDRELYSLKWNTIFKINWIRNGCPIVLKILRKRRSLWRSYCAITPSWELCNLEIAARLWISVQLSFDNCLHSNAWENFIHVLLITGVYWEEILKFRKSFLF